MTDDSISRQAAIDVLSLGKEMLCRALDDMDVVGTDRERYSWGLGLIESNINDIEELPSVERKKGNWIGIDDDPCETFECDKCGFVLDDWIQGAFYNFCPNCGADMRG